MLRARERVICVRVSYIYIVVVRWCRCVPDERLRYMYTYRRRERKKKDLGEQIIVLVSYISHCCISMYVYIYGLLTAAHTLDSLFLQALFFSFLAAAAAAAVGLLSQQYSS